MCLILSGRVVAVSMVMDVVVKLGCCGHAWFYRKLPVPVAKVLKLVFVKIREKIWKRKEKILQLKNLYVVNCIITNYTILPTVVNC